MSYHGIRYRYILPLVCVGLQIAIIAVKLAQSIRHSLWVQEVASSSPVSSNGNALVKMSVLEVPLDKELTVNCLVETRTKLEELIPAAMVIYGLNGVQLPLWLKQSLINGFSWYGLSWATVVSEHL